MNIALSLLHALKAHGAREIFGIPGDFALPFFRIVEESGVLPLYTLSHEPGIGFAADAAARFNGALGVAAVTYGAGALNMVNPVAGAYAERSPLVVISGAPGAAEVRSGMLLHHQVKTTDSQFAIYREITCAQTRLDDPATAPAEIARVLGACREQSRPVLIEVPRDAVALPCAPVRPAAPAAYDREAVEACAGEILARLAAAARPTLLVDIEVRRYGLEARVAELAHRLAIPVVTTFMGRGLLAEAAVPVAGTYLGVAGDPAVTALVEDSDCLLMLGVLLSDTNFGVSGRQIDLRKAVYAADRQVQIGFHHYPDLPLGALVEALLALVSDLDPPEPRLRPDLPPLPEAIVDGAVANTDKPPKLAKTKEHSIDLVAFDGKLSALDRATFDRALGFGKGSLKVRQANGTEELISTTRTCPRCGVGVPEIDPRWFSFNTKQGRCEACEGTGVEGGTENAEELGSSPCTSCGGTRLAPVPRSVRLAKERYPEATARSVSAAARWASAGRPAPGR